MSGGRPRLAMIPRLPNVLQLIKDGEVHLVEFGVPNARRNAEWILAHTLDCRATDLYMDAASVPSTAQVESYKRLVDRRAAREPLQYILGSTEFMSLPFHASPGVFIPRPETEILVENVEARLAGYAEASVLDMCCGSGAIAVSLLRRMAPTTAVAVDVDDRAIALTQRNAVLNRVADRIDCVRSDAVAFLSDTRHLFDAIVCNPPYVPSRDIDGLPPEIRSHEPLAGIDGGPDGLDFFRETIPHFARRLKTGGVIAFEIGPGQGKAVSNLLKATDLAGVEVRPDYNGLDRVVTATA